MKIILLRSFVVLALALSLSGCSQYASVTERVPVYHSESASGRMIAHAFEDPAKLPEAQIGRYLDAVAAAAAVLSKTPDDAVAMADYNYAVARVFDTIDESSLEPWKTPLACPGAEQIWNLSFKMDLKLRRNASKSLVVPADRYQFKGELVVEQVQKPGLGAPLVTVGEFDAHGHGTYAYYGMTGVVDIKGRDCSVRLIDPLAVETVSMGNRTYPLAANYTASLDLALAEREHRKRELDALFRPEDAKTEPRLVKFQPYNPKKIPLLCVHGLGASAAGWAPLIKSLRADPVIRANYQIWLFNYPTGYPYPLSAADLRNQMDSINALHPDHKDYVLLGHSMGGVISRLMVTDSGMKFWDVTYDKPPAEMPFSKEDRDTLSEALIFEHRKDVARVIYMSPPHRGATTATNFLGRLASKLIGAPKDMFKNASILMSQARHNAIRVERDRMPNSVDLLDPENVFVTTLDGIPPAKGIPYHSILGDQEKGGNLDRTEPVSTDGMVPYWSSHLDGAESELIIPSDHNTHLDPQGIAEVKRILYLHVGK